ncbi:MAG: PEGA domain-containing protein [Methanomicrobiales archaeon]|nr:PEGA domain-containing protein [Methanomicrobiales archaeon]
MLAAAVILPVSWDGEVTTTETTGLPGPVTSETTPPTAVPTVVTPPTTEPTTEPTTVITTVVTTIVTTAIPTTEPTVTITIPTVEPTQVGGGKGYIDTHCNVDGASVYFDGAYQCMIAQGICTVAVSPTGSPVRTVSVSKAGYNSWSGPLGRMPEDGQHVDVYATLNPTPTQTTIPPVQNGAIYAQSNPSGAAIYMNGNFQGYAPITLSNLAPGTYSMKASLAGYTPDTQLISVYSGQTATYYPTLQQSPPAPRSTGTVTVTSNPDHALIYVDGAYQGKAPLTVTLYPGSHTFRLTLPGYNDYTSTVYVSANSNQKLNAVMATAVFGTVTITSVPGATVYMDSNAQGNIPSSGILTLYNIPGGNHLFKLTASGYNDWMNTVYVQPNVVNPINAPLTPVGSKPGPAPATGGFNIVSTPTGAEVYVDNLFKGYTPATLDGIAAGSHQITLKYTGYVDYATTASVTAGQVTPLAISMQPAPAPTPESAPSLPILITGCVAVIALGIATRRFRT